MPKKEVSVKICRTCNTSKSEEEFYTRKIDCIPCYNRACVERQRRSRKADPKKWAEFDRARKAKVPARKQKGYNLKSMYGISIQDYDALLLTQNLQCAICGSDSPGSGHIYFCVDHDHACCPGKKSCGACVRGLLCGGCNKALGLFNDDIGRVANAIKYLRRF